MTWTAATFSGVTAFDRCVFDRHTSGRRDSAAVDYRRAIRRGAGLGIGTLTAAGGTAGAVTLTAVWMIAAAISGAPRLPGLPTAQDRIAFSQPDSGLAGAILGRAPAFTRSDRLVSLTSLAPPPEAERDKGPRLRAPFARRRADEGAREIAALTARGDKQKVAALPQVAAAPPSGYVAMAFDLFDPEPTAVAALAPAAPGPPQSASARIAETDNVAPPSSRLPRGLHIAGLRASAEAAAKPALPQIADAAPAAPSGLTGFLRKLFRRQPASDGPNVAPATDGHTAIYDIEAHTVYLPDGTRLEAHSGMGRIMDDPHYVNEKDRGATPPNVYDLVLREGSFHGVQAIRLKPVSDDKMFGRDGILAHPYMLGASGQSFGCVSFKDYSQFLKAFERGEVDRLVVVPYRGDYQRYAAND